jgi:tetratricopeptide (TPR) repeat protein
MTELTTINEKLRQTPTDPALWLAKGLALTELHMHYEAVEAYSAGLALAENAALRLARGRRYISLKRWSEALADLAQAARLAPESFDNWYYQGVVHALRGDYLPAVTVLETCLAIVLRGQDLSLVAPVAAWLWLLNMRLGEREKASQVLTHVTDDTPSLPQAPSYLKLVNLYKGLTAPVDFRVTEISAADERSVLYYITETYGLANYLYLRGDSESADNLLRRLKDVKENRYSFAYMMAERDIALRGL